MPGYTDLRELYGRCKVLGALPHQVLEEEELVLQAFMAFHQEDMAKLERDSDGEGGE